MRMRCGFLTWSAPPPDDPPTGASQLVVGAGITRCMTLGTIAAAVPTTAPMMPLTKPPMSVITSNHFQTGLDIASNDADLGAYSRAW